MGLARGDPGWVTRIIRAGATLTVLSLGMLTVACGGSLLPSASNELPASSARHPTQLPTPNDSNSVWVLSAIGLNMHSQPAASSDKVATLSAGTRLQVTSSKKQGSQRWLHVKTSNGNTEGWVLDDPDLVIHREVKEQSDVQDGYSILYPATWTLEQGNPATITAPTGDADGGKLLVQVSDDAAKLPTLPLRPGKESPQNESRQPVEVYGVTAFIAVYHGNDGGWEFAVEKKLGARVYLFDFQQPNRDQPDQTLYQQLLSSVTISS